MVLHEYFHGFQFKHPTDLDYFEKNIAMSDDTLRNIYKSKEWFKESVDKENDNSAGSTSYSRFKPGESIGGPLFYRERTKADAYQGRIKFGYNTHRKYLRNKGRNSAVF
jgi:hypothetical protein